MRPDLLALTARPRVGAQADCRAGQAAALHLVSAFFATNASSWCWARRRSHDKSCELEAIRGPAGQAGRGRPGSEGRPGHHRRGWPATSRSPPRSSSSGADYLLAVKANLKPGLRARRSSASSPTPCPKRSRLSTSTSTRATAGIGDRRVCSVPTSTGSNGQRRFPGEHRFPQRRRRRQDRDPDRAGRTAAATKTRYFICSRPPSAPEHLAQSRPRPPAHRDLPTGCSTSPSAEDLSRLRKGHGAKNMAVVRHFAINLVRQVQRQAIHRCAASADRNPNYLTEILQVSLHPDRCPGGRDHHPRPCDGQRALARLRRQKQGHAQPEGVADPA